MTTIHSVNEHDSSRIDQRLSSSPAAVHRDYSDHPDNGQNENGYGNETNTNPRMHSSQTAYSQGNGTDPNSSIGSKADDDRKLFVGKSFVLVVVFLINEKIDGKEILFFSLFRWFHLGYDSRRLTRIFFGFWYCSGLFD